MMRHLLLGLVVCLCLSACAQEVRVVNGQKYIAHTVAQGQTLFAISRHYAVPIDAITKANPSASQGLSIGQVLLIPQNAQVKKELKVAPAIRDGELAHTVTKKETLFGIARKYSVDQQDLVTRNPELANGVREGMVVIIPVGKVTNVAPTAVRPAENDGSKAHLVAAGETLFSLAKQYGTTAEAIQAFNGGLPDGLKVGMYVRIPAPPRTEEPVPAQPARPAPGTTFKVAYLLPFSIASNDSVRNHDGGERGYYSVTNAAVQFYAGAQLALDSLKTLGLRADVQVFDAGEDAKDWAPLMKGDAVRGMDLYIGPFHRGGIDALKKVAGGAHIVCPVPQSNKVLLGNPEVSKVLSGRPDQVQQMGRYIAYHHGRDNIILCRPLIPTEKETQDQMARALQEALNNQHDRLLRDSVLVVAPERRDVGAVIAKLNTAQRNVIVVPSEDVEFVTSLVTKLAGQVGKYRMVVFGLNSWLEMDNLEVTDLVKLDTHVPTSTFVDHADPRVNAFIAAYRDRFQNEPGDYAFLGYDVTFYYLTALMEYGRGFPAHFADVSTRPLHMAFRFMKAGGPENGYRNENAMMLEYLDSGLQLAK